METRFVFVLAVFSFLNACGAADLSVTGKPHPTSGTVAGPEDCQNGVDDNGDGLVDCQDSGCIGASACIMTCLDLCFSGDRICDAAGLKTCAKNADGCFSYGPPVACAAGLKCSAGQCAATCKDNCTEGTKQCSASGGLVTCERLGGTCTDWVGPTPCAQNKVCSAGACVDKATCQDQCTTGAVRCAAGGQKQTCAKLSTGCSDWTFPNPCAAGQTCPMGKTACETTATPPPPPSACTPGATRCTVGGGATETCSSAGAWVPGASCAQGCTAGACTTHAACSPGAVRCAAKDVQTCNSNGTAWLHTNSCVTGCAAGLCTDACTSGQKRCNGAVPETCGPGGAWSAGPTCTSGCWLGECVLPDLVIEGRTVTLSGDVRVGNAIVVRDGGVLKVAASTTGAGLTLRAKSITVDGTSRIDASGAGPSSWYSCYGNLGDLAVYAGCTYSSYRGGAPIRLFAESVVLNGKLESRGSYSTAAQYNGDVLVAADTIAGTGSFWGYHSKVLRGTSDTFSGTFTGQSVRSIMPPLELSSTTHPSPATTYNDGAATVAMAWSRPFSAVNGYYWAVTTDEGLQPRPGNSASTYTQREAVEFPTSRLSAGDNFVHVVSVDATSLVGTVKHSFPIRINSAAPSLSSTSHPQKTWKADSAVYLSWTNAEADSNFSGYAYVLDTLADTIPGATATFVTQKQQLLSNTPDGVWVFHLRSRDTRGNFTQAASHYVVYVGAEPAREALAGTLTDATTGAPLDGASLRINRGLFSTSTGPSGVYTFIAGHYVGTWSLTAEKPGYVAQTKNVVLNKGTPMAVDFALVKAP